METTITVERLDGVGALAVEQDLRRVFAEAFAEPPYGEGPQDTERAFHRFRSQVKKPGFRATLARAGNGEPVGMAYGYPLSATTGWWDTLTEPVPEEMRREDGRRTFGLFELAVRPGWRGRGVASALHRALLDGLPHERVLLNTHPEATAAQAAYRAWGYRQVGRAYPWEGAALHDVMLLELCS